MSFRNRTVIAGNNGLIHLSVPIELGRNSRLPFKDIKIANHEKWQIHHWRSLVSCYGKSPFFEYYRDELEKIFKTRYNFLFSMNVEILLWLKKVLQYRGEFIEPGIGETENYRSTGLDFTNKWLPKNFQDNEPMVKYPQVFEDKTGFQNNLSILDLLFNTGPAATGLLL